MLASSLCLHVFAGDGSLPGVASGRLWRGAALLRPLGRWLKTLLAIATANGRQSMNLLCPSFLALNGQSGKMCHFGEVT